MNRFIGAVLCSWLFLASAALAQDGTIKDRSVHTRPMALSALAYISPFYYGTSFGVVGRFEIPIVPDGFIPPINDQFSLEPSLGLGYRTWGRYGDDYTWFQITPALYGMWSFHITPKFRPYVALGLGYDIGVATYDERRVNRGGRYGDVDNSYFYWDTAIGLFWNFSEYVWFRAELGKGGPKVGLAFAL